MFKNIKWSKKVLEIKNSEDINSQIKKFGKAEKLKQLRLKV